MPARHNKRIGHLPGIKRSKTYIVSDPLTKLPSIVINVRGDSFTKSYVCPYCNQKILPGTPHKVIVPQNDPSKRRHWHSPCFKRNV